MAAAWRDDHGATGGLVQRRQIRSDGRFVNVRHNMIAAVRDTDFLVARFAFRTGRTVRPEQNFLWFGGEYGNGEQHRGTHFQQKRCGVHVFWIGVTEEFVAEVASPGNCAGALRRPAFAKDALALAYRVSFGICWLLSKSMGGRDFSPAESRSPWKKNAKAVYQSIGRASLCLWLWPALCFGCSRP